LTSDEIKKHATSIRNSVTSSLDLIDNTLFWSLSQTGNISYTPSTFSLNEMVKKLKELYQLTAEKKRINFNVITDERINIYADENMIYVTLRNIVSNAIKFTNEGKSVTISIDKNHQLAEIKVIDEGIGMSKSYIKKLFAEEHLQIKKGTSNEKGTGLGLVLCKKFVDLNNGFMQIESEEEKGTEFIVQLPLAQN
jgi:signal transduction histidine kinase